MLNLSAEKLEITQLDAFCQNQDSQNFHNSPYKSMLNTAIAKGVKRCFPLLFYGCVIQIEKTDKLQYCRILIVP